MSSSTPDSDPHAEIILYMAPVNYRAFRDNTFFLEHFHHKLILRIDKTKRKNAKDWFCIKHIAERNNMAGRLLYYHRDYV